MFDVGIRSSYYLFGYDTIFEEVDSWMSDILDSDIVTHHINISKYDMLLKILTMNGMSSEFLEKLSCRLGIVGVEQEYNFFVLIIFHETFKSLAPFYCIIRMLLFNYFVQVVLILLVSSYVSIFKVGQSVRYGVEIHGISDILSIEEVKILLVSLLLIKY